MFTIITPVYNRADCLPRCVESVLGQDCRDWEMVIVDDGSQDNSLAVARAYAAADPRIRVLAQPRNRGTNAARNWAVREGRGRFALILDSDDYLADGALARVRDTIDVCPGYRHYLFQADDLLDYYRHTPALNRGAEHSVLAYRDWLAGDVGGDFIHVIDREMMAALPFDEETRILEGVNFMRFYREGGQQLYTPVVVTHRDRGRTDSVTPTAYLTSTAAMRRSLRANRLWLDYFTADCQSMGLAAPLAAKRRQVRLLTRCLSWWGYPLRLAVIWRTKLRTHA